MPFAIHEANIGDFFETVDIDGKTIERPKRLSDLPAHRPCGKQTLPNLEFVHDAPPHKKIKHRERITFKGGTKIGAPSSCTEVSRSLITGHLFIGDDSA